MKKKENDELVQNEAENGSKEVIKKPRKSISKSIKNKAKKTVEKIDNDIVTKNYDFNLLEVVIIILITGVVVSIASGFIIYNNYDNLFNDSNSSSNDSLDKSQLKLFEENYNRILNEYVSEVDKDELLNAAISGMYDYLGDDYSSYLDPDDTQSLNEQLEGQYTGIGVEIFSFLNPETNEYEIYISKIFKDTPAEEAGLMVDDRLIELNGESLKEKDANYVSSTIKNSKELTHKLKVLRNGEEIELTLTKKLVYINSVTSEVKDGVGYIKVETFSNTVTDQVKKHLDEMDPNVKSLVVDVRDNTGGYLTSAHTLSDLFVEKGKVIYQTKDKNNVVASFKAEEDVYRKFDKIAVLVNENSASASEIFALALKESAGAKIVGKTTFGKGSVQETKILPNGAMVKITTHYWLSPNGNSINLNGIKPDIVVEDVNIQLDEAIKAVK